MGIPSANLDALFGYNVQIFLRILDCTEPAIIPIKPNENSFGFVALGRGLREAGYAVPAMCCCQHLNLVRVCRLKDHLPETALSGMVDAVLRFIDQEEAAATVGQCQGHAEDAYRTIAKTLQWHGSGFARPA